MPPGEPIRVAVANDYELVVVGLAAMLAPFSDKVEVCDAIVLGQPISQPVDVALYDTFGRQDGTREAVTQLLDSGQVKLVVIYTGTPRAAQAAAAVDAGAAGVLSKSRPAAAVVDAIERIVGGEQVVDDGGGTQHAPWPGAALGLTARQSEVVALLLQGMTNAEIADALFVDINTVKTHLRHVYKTLGARSRSQVLARLLPAGEFGKVEAGGPTT
jgi:NarL family two-component system response regulator LiaR